MKQPFDTIIALDFETAWGRKAELGFSCQTNEEYLRDPRFKAWGLSWKTVGTDEIPVWIRHDRIKRWAAGFDWTRTAVVCQNTQFDGTILSWIYGIHPCFMFDTLAMGRALYGVEVGNSLKALAERFELPPKGDGLSPSENILDELPFHVEQTLADYCKHDTWLCEQIFLRMLPQFPSKELRLIDMTLRMYTRPLLRLDSAMLQDAIEDERSTRESLLQRLNVAEAELASNDRFAEVLRSLGIDPPLKKSKTTGQETWAFAKNDALFQALVNSDNEEVALLCEARLKVKSTTERTRAQRFLDISTRGNLPVPLSYYGAATGRWTASKGSAINMQNLKRGSFLRKAIMAPEDHVLVVGDLSQIEPRVLAWLSDYEDLLRIFRNGGDPYAQFGAPMFGIPGMTKDSHPTQRQSAKSALLGCFGGNTPVLTQRGWVIIQDVLPEDRVWDGLEWVTHQGVVPQGEKAVLTAHGISATSDHEILTERGWVEWSAVLADPSLFQSARSLANSHAWSGADAKRAPSGASPFLRQRMPTYDIAQAGPRNRYTILTDDGPLIVHNCGYQLGWASFATQLLTGFLGAPPKRYTRDEAKQLGVTGADVQKFLGWEENLKAMEAIPHTCSTLELAIHCLAAKAIIDKYRATAVPVVGFWNLLGELITHSLFKGNEYTHKCLTFRKEEIVLPSGMSLRYPDLRPEDGPKGRVQWTYADGRNGKRSKLYPGKVCNNVTQGTARCVMTDGMLRVAKRYPVVGTVHDEQIAVAPVAEKDEAKTWVLAQMITTPSYLPGIPLNADVGAHERYGLAKG